ncbi:trypsin-like serine peptidase [Nonomuraea sp. NPDC050790]|uniref:trypsin-like serine peptidase n=1 Tax=Nonomuraea sp. NPDC050790 TaxID=3364371 RepID=UPI003789BBBF
MTLSTPLLAAAPLVAGLVGPALIGAAPAQQPPGRPSVTSVERAAPRAEVVEHVAARSPADQRRVLGYWTPRRMAAALPIDLLGIVMKDGGLLSGTASRSGVGTRPEVTGGVARLPVPELPGKGPATDRAVSELLDGAAASVAPGALGTAARATPQHQSARPQTTTSGSRWVTGGLVSKTTGRVFLTVAGVDFVCSAGTVKSANRDVVVTAGHCVKDGAGEWADNWTFVPGYQEGGGQPYGAYTARRMFVAGPWSRSGDDSYDVGMVALNTHRGRHVGDVVGFQEIAFNGARGGQAYGFGYPADPPYDGERLFYCAGRLRNDPYGQTRDQGLGCDMTAGSSGGPWLTRFDAATGKGTVTSVSSFKYSDDQGTMYGPYFGDSARALFTTAQNS